MKFPRNRADIYTVVRVDKDGYTAILGIFSDLEEADNFKDACASEWFDKTKGTPANFVVRLSTYYG